MLQLEPCIVHSARPDSGTTFGKPLDSVALAIDLDLRSTHTFSPQNLTAGVPVPLDTR